MMAGAGMGQGVLGRYAPIKQMQGSAQQAMGGGPDNGAVQPAAIAGLRAQMQNTPKPAMGAPSPAGTTGTALQSLMGKMRGMNPALPGR